MDSEQIELYGEEFIRRTARSEKGLRNSARPAGKTAAGTQEYTGNTTRNRIQQKTEQDRTENGADDLSEENRHSENQHFTWFTSQGIITGPGVLVKPGKEASVWRCPGNPAKTGREVAVKIYKDIGTRSFRSMTRYLEGRLEDAGVKRRDRMHLVSSPQNMQGFWILSEFNALKKLSAAGLAVPAPYAMNGNALAMEFIAAEDSIEENGSAAPRLQDLPASFRTDSAGERLSVTLLAMIETMLACDLVHGDLSPYNILIRGGCPVIIDFPQAVDARFNSEARFMLERDIRNVLRFFRPDPESREDAARYAEQLWEQYMP